MSETKTSSTGYGDSNKLKAAKELLESFKKGPHKGKAKKKSETSSPRSDFSMLSRPYYQQKPPPPTNIPPPSQRQFSSTWVSNPEKTRSGPIIGKKAVDFLARKDANVVTKGIYQATEGQTNHVVQSPTAQPRNQGSFAQQQGRKIDMSTNTAFVTTAAASQIRTTAAKKASSIANQASKSIQIHAQLPEPPNLTGILNSQSQSGQCTSGKKGILNTFFSLLDEDSDDMPEGLMPSLTPKSHSVANRLAIQETAKCPERPPSKSDQETGAQNMDVRNMSTSPMQSQSRGKTDSNETQRDKRLRPEAPGFIPGQATQGALNNVSGSISPAKSGSSSHCTDALKWTPPKRNVPAQRPEMPANGHIVQTGPSVGHIVSVTPVEVTDGFIIPGPGPTTGTLWLQTPVAVNQGGPVSLGSHLDTSPSRVTSPGLLVSKIPEETAQRPIAGLKGSIWA